MRQHHARDSSLEKTSFWVQVLNISADPFSRQKRTMSSKIFPQPSDLVYETESHVNDAEIDTKTAGDTSTKR